MTKSKTTNKILSIIVIMLFITTLFMVFLQNGISFAQLSIEDYYNKGINVSTLDYEGTHNKCCFDVKIIASSINNSYEITDTEIFEIYLTGRACNILFPGMVEFKYDIDFTLFKDGKQKEVVNKKFTIAKEKEVDNNVISVFKSHYGNGEYTLHITGTIDSVDIEKINHSINFKIAE